MDAKLQVWTVLLGAAVLAAAAAQGATGEPQEEQLDTATAVESAENLPCPDLGGIWMGSQEVGTVTLETWTPVEPSGRRYVQQYELLNLDPTLWGLFPTAVRLTVFTGELERTSGRGMKWQSVAHALDAASGIVYTLLMRGTATLVNCKKYTFGGTFAVYAPGQDPFTEEPAFGCFPMSPGTSLRMGPWRACTAAP